MGGSDRPVVIAYDGSAAARRAVIDCAGLLSSHRTLVVTVWEPGLAYAMPPPATGDMLMAPAVGPNVALGVDRAVHEHAERVSRDGAQLARSLGLRAEPLAVPDGGDVPSTLLRIAREHRAAAIIVGSRGLGGLRARLEGSTSKSLLKHAACPVVIVHDTDDRDD